MYHAVQRGGQVSKSATTGLATLTERCLGAFVRSGTLELSLDHLASVVGISKRMLIHYFGKREAIEERAMALLEDRLRVQFAPENFPSGVDLGKVVQALWDRTTHPDSRGVLLLLMDLSRRAWNGSPRAKSFYEEQQRLWADLLLRYLPDKKGVDDVLQTFQGSVLAYLITGDPKPGRRTLTRICAGLQPQKLTKARAAK
jgi:AcrR family transcriptional regulator